MVCPYNGMSLSHKKEKTIDNKIIMISKSSQTKRVYIVHFQLYKVQVNANKCIVTESRAVVAWGEGRLGGRDNGKAGGWKIRPLS